MMLVSLSVSAFSQSPRTSLIEHFTNTRCGVCAARNPAFYQTLSAYPSVLHVSFHPSSPYSQCLFSRQNPTENDSRTKYYNAYGSTPRIAVNGKIQSTSSSLITSSALDEANIAPSPIEISVMEMQSGNDSIKVRVAVKTTQTIPHITSTIFVGIVENPVNYNAPNGENIHHDVFRKALTAIVGNSITLPMLHDSVVFNFTYGVSKDWNINNIYTLAFVQNEETKEILNASKSKRVVSNPNSVDESLDDMLVFLPNPVLHRLQVKNFLLFKNIHYTIFNIVGLPVADGILTGNDIDVSFLSEGSYYVKVGEVMRKFIKL